MISTKKYLSIVEENIVEPFLNDGYDRFDLEVIQVWYCKTIQNHKGLFIIKDLEGGMIFPNLIEVTYNGNREEMYFDFYTKDFKHTISCKDI